MKSLSPLCRGELSNAAMEDGKRDVRIILQPDGVYNWPQHRLKYGRRSEKPAAHTQQKNDPCTLPRGVSITYSSTIISILAMVLLSILFFEHLILLIATLQVYISLLLYPRVGHRRSLIRFIACDHANIPSGHCICILTK